MWSETIMPELLRRELGVHNWVHDRGGKTAHGITQRVADRIGVDIDLIDEDQAMTIFHDEYFQGPGFNTIDALPLAWRLTVDGLHSGTRTIIKRTQWLYNLGLRGTVPRPLVLDGILGARTRTAYNRRIFQIAQTYQERLGVSPEDSKPLAIMDLATQWKSGQFSLYCDICANDVSQRVFFEGWQNRIRFEPEWYV